MEKFQEGVVMKSEEAPPQPVGTFCRDFGEYEHPPKTHYVWSYNCSNCGRGVYVYIPKGVRHANSAWSHVCDRCGCSVTHESKGEV